MMTVQYDPASRPHIQTNHIDGPLLFLRDGTVAAFGPTKDVLQSLQAQQQKQVAPQPTAPAAPPGIHVRSG